MSDFRSVMLRFDPDDGSAEIQDRERWPGMRVVIETLNGAGEHVYVVRYPPYSYAGLARRAYAPAKFEVFVEDYTENHLGREEREEDAPWIRVRPVVSFPVSVGTKAGLGL